mgnify:CR=1 FL=1
MAAASLVLNTSHSEGMCNSILEAMLIGTPVVARAMSELVGGDVVDQ